MPCIQTIQVDIFKFCWNNYAFSLSNNNMMNTDMLRVGSLNTRGLNDIYKRLSLFSDFKKSDLSFIFFAGN